MSTDDTSESDAQSENQDEQTVIQIDGEKVVADRDDLSSIKDHRVYSPVRMDGIDTPGATTEVETPTPIGRRRVATTTKSIEDQTVKLPHQSCDHILVTGLPRVGKDSVVTSIGKNLRDEHGYSYVSIHDDGRNETPLLALPNNEEWAKDGLDTFGQTPEGMETEVFVPATGDLPNHLPANFRPFTIGLNSLTPEMMMHLASFTGRREATTTLQGVLHDALGVSESLSEFETRLRMRASETEVTVEVSEHGEDGETSELSYRIAAEKALNRVADRVAELADVGLLASPDTATNIDMESVIDDQDRAAVLCCTFLDAGQQGLKYILEDLWLQLLYQARDENPRLPRVCLELRQIEELAPSKLADMEYPGVIKGLRSTVTRLSTQGGSRRILMVASTSKHNDVYRPVRENMPTKILLRSGNETIESLDRTYHFSDEQKRHLTSFDSGSGLLVTGGRSHWPIDFRPTPCALGTGDQHWRDRYGRASGARVQTIETDEFDADWWVSTSDGDVHETGCPEVGDWYLLPEDFPDGTGREDVDVDLVADALDSRRAEGVQSDLSLQLVGIDETDSPDR